MWNLNYKFYCKPVTIMTNNNDNDNENNDNKISDESIYLCSLGAIYLSKNRRHGLPTNTTIMTAS